MTTTPRHVWQRLSGTCWSWFTCGIMLTMVSPVLAEPPVAATTTNHDRPLLARIAAGEEIAIGVNRDYPPFCIRVAGQLKGFDIALAQELARVTGMKYRFVEDTIADHMENLAQGRIDIAIAAMTVTASRASRIHFSRPYLTITQAAIVDRRRIPRITREGQVFELPLPTYFALNQIRGLRLAVRSGTEVERQARQNFPNAQVRTYATVQEAFGALSAKQVDAVVHDSPSIEFLYHRYPDQARRLKTVLGHATTERIAIGMRQSDLDFLRFLDTFVQSLIDNGSISRWYEQYVRHTAWLASEEK